MRPRFNLASQPFINLRPFLLTTSLLGVAAVALSVVLAVVALTTWRTQTATLERLQGLQRQRADLVSRQGRLQTELRDAATQRLLKRTHELNQMIRHKSLSWTELFYDLQQHLPAGARILSLAPSLRDDGRLLVQMQVGGESPAAVLEFLRVLGEGTKFRELALKSQRRGSPNSPDRTVAEVSAVYVQE